MPVPLWLFDDVSWARTSSYASGSKATSLASSTRVSAAAMVSIAAADGVTSRPAVDARADQRECDASSAEFVGNLQGAAITGLQQRAVALPGVVVRADRVDNPLGRQVACGRPSGVARGEPVGESLDAVAQDRRAPPRWIAPWTPPPPRMTLFAALMIASTSCFVMSPRTAVMTGTPPSMPVSTDHTSRRWGLREPRQKAVAC